MEHHLVRSGSPRNFGRIKFVVAVVDDHGDLSTLENSFNIRANVGQCWAMLGNLHKLHKLLSQMFHDDA